MALQIAFVPHGGGPLPLMNDPNHASLVKWLKGFSAGRTRPSAILIVSAHYETMTPTLTSSAQPSLYFDYYGFPEETYRYAYPAPGAPDLAAEIAQALTDKGVGVQLDTERGLDHGAFVPLMLMYPDADIPALQLSLSGSLDPEMHLRLGEALSGLADKDILVLGSGMSFHNMDAFRRASSEIQAANERFQDWLVATLGANDWADQRQCLAAWASAPGARAAHPREEHLLPLHVCAGLAGATGGRARICFDDELMGYRALGVDWG